MGDAILPAVDESVQVLVAPAEGDLEGVVEVGDAAVAADKEPAPDQGADAAQHDAEPVDAETGGRRRIRHPAILLPLTSPALSLPQFVPLCLRTVQARFNPRRRQSVRCQMQTRTGRSM